VAVQPWVAFQDFQSHGREAQMKHLTVISRASLPADSETTALEQILILLLGVYFRDWDNFASVIQNLTKFYQKT